MAESPAPPDTRIPMLVLGGWLGSGKTTLVNRLLAEAPGDERIVVLVNDIGEVDVDAALIASRTGDTVELTNGCACCTIGGSLGLALRDQVLGPNPPDRLVVEASGVAEPDRVAAYGDRRRIRPDGVVVCVDACETPSRADDIRCGELFRRQVAAADLLVVTKADLLVGDGDGGDAARRWLADKATAPVMTASPATGWVASLLCGAGGAEEPDRQIPVGPLDFPVRTATWTSPTSSAADVAAVLGQAAGDRGLLRAKGIFADGVVHLAAGRAAVDERIPGSAAPGHLVLIGLPDWEPGALLAQLDEIPNQEPARCAPPN